MNASRFIVWTPIVAVVLSMVSPSNAASQSRPPSCTAPEHHQFDFWVGDWDVFLPDSHLAGRNTIERVASGCALLENWAGTRGGSGKSINFWSPEDRQWHQTWAGAGESFLFLSGNWTGDRMVMTGSHRDSTGIKGVERITWTPQKDGSVRQHWEQSKDGVTWTDAFVGIYRRRKT